MYARFEAGAWVATNLLWLEEAHQLLVDARGSFGVAVKIYADGFPSPPEGIAVPGAVSLDPPGPPDQATVKRASQFRYYIDNSIVRSSACFQKASGLLASYYRIRMPRTNQLYWDSELFTALRKKVIDGAALARLRAQSVDAWSWNVGSSDLRRDGRD